MKKIFMIFAAAVAALSLASCNKAEIDEPATGIKLNISVSCPMGEGTKAVKTGWEPGDKINIWYEGNAQRDPDLVIKYDGSEWKNDASATVSGNEPAASGKIFFVYESGNDLSKYLNMADMYYDLNGIKNIIYTDNYQQPTSYTYADGTISANIEEWLPMSEFQVVVTDIDPSQYQLKCTNLLKFRGFKVAGSSASSANSGYNEYVSGANNTDGAAFYFRAAQDRTASAEYVFTLKNIDTNEEKTYTVTGKTHQLHTFTAIKIDASNFTSVPEYVTIGGKKWATMNLGATTVAGSPETCYGDYYAWGETTPRYTGITITPDGSGYGNITINGWTNSEFTYTPPAWPTFTGDVLDAEHDAATQAFGSAWRTPSRQDFIDLLEACGGVTSPNLGDISTTAKGVYYCRDYDGVQGYLFSDGTSQLFFPRCGVLGNDAHLNKTVCFYTTSELMDGNQYNRYVWAEGSFTTYPTAFGCTIRPISD